MNEHQNTTSPTDDRTDDAPKTCGERRTINVRDAELPVTCSREPDHFEDHFDEQAGIGWPNEGKSSSGLTQEERLGAALDRLGVPAGRNGVPWTLVQRHNLFVDRISRRLYDQVENNMILMNTCRDVLTLLRGAPNAKQFRIKTAIDKLEPICNVARPGSKIISS